MEERIMDFPIFVPQLKVELAMKYCGKCGQANEDGARFCGKCGNPFETAKTTVNQSGSGWVNHLGNYVGSNKPVDLNWRVLFSDVLQKHSREEAEEIFICGTRTTTPAPQDVSKSWPHPWLYSRVFLAFALAFVLLYVCIVSFGNLMALPGLMTVGAFTVPLAALVLFLEMNAFRNVSFYDVAQTFLVGGCASLLITLVLYTIFDVEELDYIGAFTVGFVEEVGKAVIVYYFIKKIGKTNILAGLLIGAAVGAGFAAFETAGYVMFSGVESWESMMGTIFVRGFLAPGGHVAWAAISGAAMVIASKQTGEMNLEVLVNGKFLRLFVIPVVLHGLWDSPLANIGSEIFLVHILLTIFVWIVVLILINMGLAEIPASEGNAEDKHNNIDNN